MDAYFLVYLSIYGIYIAPFKITTHFS